MWSNFAPDHLNWHRDLAAYERAKANLWANLRATDVAVGDAGDPVVMANLARAAWAGTSPSPPPVTWVTPTTTSTTTSTTPSTTTSTTTSKTAC